MAKKKKNNHTQKYVVWVGGVEVNDYYTDMFKAHEVAEHYKKMGYDDVAIECVLI